MGRPVWSDHRLSFVLVDQIQGRAGVKVVEGIRVDEEVQNRGDNSHGCRVGLHLNTRHEGVVENKRHPEIANVSILVRSRLRGVFTECLATGWGRGVLAYYYQFRDMN